MTWEADSQLVRGRGLGYNLAIGEPEFLRQVLAPYYPRHYAADVSYPDTRPDPDLLRELQRFYPGQEVVVTVGAKQALYAAATAIRSLEPEYARGDLSWQYGHLYHRQPYWPTYPTIANRVFDSTLGTRFATTGPGQAFTIVCNTSPNNPDGSEDLSKCDIWDAAYASPAYGWSGGVPEHKVSVWSAGKLLGCPGVRVGWLATKDPVLAEYARQYVEQTTSGVPTTSQYFVAATLRNLSAPGLKRKLAEEARRTLIQNYATFLDLFPWLTSWSEEYRGMFQWFRPKNPEGFTEALVKAGVMMVSGEACGASEAQGYFRCSLGLDSKTFETAINALITHLERNDPI